MNRKYIALLVTVGLMVAGVVTYSLLNRIDTDDDRCESNGAIVTFNDGIPKERRREIAEEIGARIVHEYEVIPGFSVETKKGSAQRTIDAFKAYSEVKNATPDMCYRIN